MQVYDVPVQCYIAMLLIDASPSRDDLHEGIIEMTVSLDRHKIAVSWIRRCDIPLFHYRGIPDEKLTAVSRRRRQLPMTFARARAFDSSDANIEPEERYVPGLATRSAATWTLPRVGKVGTRENRVPVRG
ncbi:hypothetical protein HN011_009772 [Eciton burchellii]|jgi:hypothetical protein|nr:hypothetical protein HN011_009772 [Eciton burchellii]